MKNIKFERKQYNKLKYNRYIKKTVILETVTGWSFLTPLLVIALIFSTSAIGIGIWLTFTEGSSLDDSLDFVGLKNWKFLSNSALHLGKAFENTFFYAAVSVPVTLLIALVVSAILNSSLIKRKELFLGIFFLPQVTSAIASTLIFRRLLSKEGFIKIDYIENPDLIIWVVIVSAIWGGVAGSLVTLNTAFSSIDKTQYDAAAIDGASGIKIFTNVTVPSILPIIAYSLLMGVIGGLGVFDGPYLLAKTAAVDPDSMSTLMLVGFKYIQPFDATQSANIGLGTTILFMTAMVMAAATIFVNQFMPINKKTN